jgi:hypothetical protein
MAWSAAGLLVLAIVLIAFALATAPSEDERVLDQVKAVIAEQHTKQPAEPEVERLIKELNQAQSIVAVCDAIILLSAVAPKERARAYAALSEFFDGAGGTAKTCVANAFVWLGQTERAASIYAEWSGSDNADLRRAAVEGQALIARQTKGAVAR